MITEFPSESFSRRRFVGKVAPAAALLGATTCLRPMAGAAEPATKNPFAYDVSRYAKTDPALIGWIEVATHACPVKETRRLAAAADGSLAVAAGRQLAFLRGSTWELSSDLGGSVGCTASLGDGTWLAGLRDRVALVDAGGKRIAAWEAAGPKAWLTGIAVAGDTVWVADSGQRLVLQYDRKGKLLGRLGAKTADGKAPGFILPSPFLDVRSHPDGLLRVNNPGRHRIEAYTVDGHFELAWGKPSAAIDGFCGCCNPIALAVLPDGRIVTGEKGLPRVKVHKPDGTLESVVAGTESFAENARRGADASDRSRWGLDVAVDGAGRIVVLDRVMAAVRLFKAKEA